MPDQPINNQTVNPEPPHSPPVISTEQPTVAVVKKTPQEMMAQGLGEIKSKLPFSKSSFPIKKVVIIAVIVFVILILLLVGVSILSRFIKPKPVAIATPTPEATFIPATPTPSRYATDSAVLDIEKNIETLDKELSEVDLDEVNIKPRTLKWDVTFK